MRRNVLVIIVFGLYVDRWTGRIYHSQAASLLLDWKFQGAPQYALNSEGTIIYQRPFRYSI